MFIRSIFNFFRILIKKSLFNTFLLILMPGLVLADRVGNGGGVAEQNVLEAYLHFPSHIENCLKDKACAGGPADQVLLQKILQGLVAEKNLTAEPIQFKSGREFPYLFSQNNCSQIWCTSAQPGATIFFNTDEIVGAPSGAPGPISMSEARRYLFLAFGAHQEGFDFFTYDRIALRLSKISRSSIAIGKLERANFSRIDPLPAEAWLNMFLTNMDLILGACLDSKECVLTEPQIAIVKKIFENHNTEKSPDLILKFESGKLNPSRFTIDGELKAAVTGLSPQDLIYFNTDFLYKAAGSHQLVSIEASKLLTLLIHELGHHTGSQDHNQLDQVGLQISRFLSVHFPVLEFVEAPEMSLFHVLGHFRSLILPNRESLQRSRVLLADEVGFTDISPMLSPYIQCPARQKLESYAVNLAEWTGDFKYSGILERAEYFFEEERLQQNVQMVIYNMNFDVSQICVNELGRRNFISWQKVLPMLYTVHLEGFQLRDMPLELYQFKKIF